VPTALAQDSNQEAIEEVVVTGYRSSIIAAREAKRMSDSISDSIVAEDIGKSTDESIAEALNRVTGITIQPAEGQISGGQTVTVRGLDPNLNLVTLNGVVLGSPDDGRAVDLSAYSADMLSQIDVVKTANASHNEGSLGGAVNLKTVRPLARNWERVTGELQWRSTDFDGEDDFKASFGLSQKFADDRFGIAATVIVDNQFRRTDLFDTFDWRVDRYRDPISLQTGQVIPGEVWGAAPRFSNHRVDGLNRDNTTANVVFQVRPNDMSDIFLDLSYSKLDIENDRYQFQSRNWFSNNPNAGNPDCGEPGSNPGRALACTAIFDEENQTFLFTHSQRVAGFMQTRYLQEERDQLTATLGGSFDVGALTVDAKISRMDLDAAIPVWNQVNFQGVATNTSVTPPVGFSCGIEIDPVTNIPTPGGTQWGSVDRCIPLYGGWFNPLDSTWNENVGPRLSQARVNGRQVNDEATSAFLDFDYELEDSAFTSLEFGFKYSDQSKDRFQQDVGINTSTTPGDPGRVPVGQFGQPFPYSDGYLGDERAPNQAERWIVPDLNTTFALLWPDGIPDVLPNPIQTWDISEEVMAAYAMVNFETSAGFFGNVGLRYVETEIAANGTSGYTFRTARPTYMDLQDSDCTSVASGVCFVEVPVAETKRYQQVLPSFNLNHLINEDMLLRMGVSKTMARPTFNDVRPNGNVNIPSSGGGAQTTFQGGNTLLEPLISTNLDLSWEWYFGDSDLLSVALFYKDMEDFVFTASTLRQFINPIDPKPGEDRSQCPGIYLCDETLGLQDTDGDGVPDQFPIADVITTIPVNGAGAEILGVELSYQQTFDSLPGFWSGFGLLFNYTYADSEADYTDASGPDDPYEGYPFINTSEHSINSTLFWENDRVSARLAYWWRDDFLVDPTRLQMSTWSEDYASLDASFTINVTDRIAVTGNAVNLLDASSREYQTIAFVNSNQPGVVPEGNALQSDVYNSRTKTVGYFGRTYRLGFRVTF
jgi:TonB-dependent receptor